MDMLNQVVDFVIWLVMYLPAMFAEYSAMLPYLSDMDPTSVKNVFAGGEGFLAAFFGYRYWKGRKNNTPEV